MTCESCNREIDDLRMGHCWDCATAESIIDDGTDMYDIDINGVTDGEGSKTAMKKLEFLVKKGWQPPAIQS